RAREQQVKDMPPRQAAATERLDELRALLDQELSRLPDKYRVPVVLCDLEGRTRKEAARQLGWPEGTVAGRLARARRLLARRLARYGLPVLGGTLAAALPESTASAGVPAALLAATCAAAGLRATAPAAAGAISARVAALVEGVMKNMLLARLKVVLVIVLAVRLLGAAGIIPYRTATAAPSPPELPSTAELPPAPEEPAPAPQANP